MSNNLEPRTRTPVLRLRPVAPTEQIRPRQKIKQPDGPWIAHPRLIDEEHHDRPRTSRYAPDITMNDYRNLWKEDHTKALDAFRSLDKSKDLVPSTIIECCPSVDMQKTQGMTDHEIASALEKHYVGAHQYRL